MLDEAVRAYHPALAEAGVTFALTFTSPAPRHHGYPAHAVVRVNSVRDRVEGKADVGLVICEESWEGQTAEERLALMDHELTHLELALDRDTGRPKADEAGRPRLKTRRHDFELGGFTEVVRRHKIAAPEARGYRELHRAWQQTLLPWG